MFELFVFALGVVLGSVVTHMGYQNFVAKLKAELISLESKIKPI